MFPCLSYHFLDPRTDHDLYDAHHRRLNFANWEILFEDLLSQVLFKFNIDMPLFVLPYINPLTRDFPMLGISMHMSIRSY